MTDQIQPVLQGARSGRALLDATDAILLLLDHQAGLFQTVTGPLAELPGWLQAAGCTITFQDIPVEPWRDGLLERGLPVHQVNHLVTMADLHRAGRYDRMSDDVLMLTGQGPLSLQEFVRENATTFTASAKEGGERADG
jgi:hypothetical protein